MELPKGKEGDKKDMTVGQGTVYNDSLLYKYLLSAASAIVAETVTYPLDLTKTRLQIQGEVSLAGGNTVSHSKRGMYRILHGIVTEEGFFKLWQGVPPALYRHIFYTGSRLNIYEYLRSRVFMKNDDGTFTLWKGVVCGTVSGALGQLIASPTDLVKVNMQMEGRRRLEGHPVRMKSCSHAFRTIIAQEGVAGLWRGWVPNVQRAALVNLGDLVTYDTVKHQLLNYTNLPDNYIVHAIASACAGLIAAIMCTPADVVKTRIMNQPIDNGRPLLYKGSVDCFMTTVRQEGFFALYKGLFSTYCRLVSKRMLSRGQPVNSLGFKPKEERTVEGQHQHTLPFSFGRLSLYKITRRYLTPVD